MSGWCACRHALTLPQGKPDATRHIMLLAFLTGDSSEVPSWLAFPFSILHPHRGPGTVPPPSQSRPLCRRLLGQQGVQIQTPVVKAGLPAAATQAPAWPRSWRRASSSPSWCWPWARPSCSRTSSSGTSVGTTARCAHPQCLHCVSLVRGHCDVLQRGASFGRVKDLHILVACSVTSQLLR